MSCLCPCLLMFSSTNSFLYFLDHRHVLLVPWLIYGYRKDGFSAGHALPSVFVHLLYSRGVLSRHPAFSDNPQYLCPAGSRYGILQSRSLHFCKDIMKETPIVWSQPSTYMGMIQGRAFLQIVFNVLLLMPLGVYIRYFFQKRSCWKYALLGGFGLSLFLR